MTPQERLSQAFEYDIRIERILDLASQWSACHDMMRMPECVEEMIQDSWEEESSHPSTAAFMKPFRENEDQKELEILQQMPAHEVTHFLLEVVTPVRRFYTSDSWSSGWGHYYNVWIMAETLDEGWKLAVEWAKEKHELDRATFEAHQPKAEKPKLN